MSAPSLIGRRITAVRQSDFETTSGRKYPNIDAIVLDDGTELNFATMEGETEYGVKLIIRPKRKTK